MQSYECTVCGFIYDPIDKKFTDLPSDILRLAMELTWSMYRVNIKSFLDYKDLLQENDCGWNINFFKCNTRSFFYNTLVHFNTKNMFVFHIVFL